MDIIFLLKSKDPNYQRMIHCLTKLAAAHMANTYLILTLAKLSPGQDVEEAGWVRSAERAV